jgi:aspartokinase/homoserine dehydrogenase 1
MMRPDKLQTSLSDLLPRQETGPNELAFSGRDPDVDAYCAAVPALEDDQPALAREPRPTGPAPEGIARSGRPLWRTSAQDRHSRHRTSRPLQILKFGGTSLGDVDAIRRVLDIIQAAATSADVVIVVSAMSGVTNKLIEAARLSEAGDRDTVSRILEELRTRHTAAADSLIHSAEEGKALHQRMEALFAECEQLCLGTQLLRELTPRTRDAISGLGERLSAPLVATALRVRGLNSEAVDATDLIVTNANHGSAEPLPDLTNERCQLRLRPLLRQGVVPVVTGYIGATNAGVLTTLGRGGSDYSATIVGAALDATEVVIWTDVDGVLTADPRLVPGAATIPEISYSEAAELAYFGAKVLHPKTLHPLMQSGVPVLIRNTFSPERAGTKITPDGSPETTGVKALTAIKDVALVTVGGPGIVGMTDVLCRTFSATASVQAEVLMVSQSSSQNDICFVVSSHGAKRTVEALRQEFSQDLEREKVEHITVDSNVAVVAAVGQRMRGMAGIAGRTFGALGKESVNVIAIAQGSSECNISFLIALKDMKAALTALHREFQLSQAGA